jgi:hypothetical protein
MNDGIDAAGAQERSPPANRSSLASGPTRPAAKDAARAPSAPGASGAGRAARKPRDLRLDFFRGLAMFIILMAHIPNNAWTLWIPARFGFSDATEIFVFCSGLASSLAFGSVFRERGFGLGSARIVFRIWQVYWAHIGLVIAVTALLALFDRSGWGSEGLRYLGMLPLIPWTDRFEAALIGLLTLTWVPNYFDILPMYLGILAMLPAVMLAHRLGGRAGAALLVGGVWAVAQTGALDLQSRPWADDLPWFFNPFGWQLAFFTGFGFGMGWIPAPPRDRRLAWAAILVLVISLPLAWHKLHEGLWLPEGALHGAIAQTRAAIEPLWAKSPFGLLRWVHFLALGYVAWLWAGIGGARLRAPLTLPGAPRAAVLAVASVVALATLPYVAAQEIRALSPALEGVVLAVYGDGAQALLGTDLLFEGEQIGMVQIVHLLALAPLIWALIGGRARGALAGPIWIRTVEVIRKVGSQSLAVFLASMALAQVGGFAFDIIGADVWTRALVNLTGIAALIAVAYGVGWFKSQPWQLRPDRAA